MIGELIDAPAEEPVTLEQAKKWLRLDEDIAAPGGEEDDLIAGLIVTARMNAESTTRRAIIWQRWALYRDCLPACFELPMGKTISVDKISVKDDAGDLQLVGPSVYQVSTKSDQAAKVALLDGQVWPEVPNHFDAVEIEVTVGIAADASEVPEKLRTAMLVHIHHMYEHREELAFGTTVVEVPGQVQRLLGSYVVPRERM